MTTPPKALPKNLHIVTKDVKFVARLRPIFEAASWTVESSEEFLLPQCPKRDYSPGVWARLAIWLGFLKPPETPSRPLSPPMVRLSNVIDADTRSLSSFSVIIIDTQLEHYYQFFRNIWDYRGECDIILELIGLFPEKYEREPTGHAIGHHWFPFDMNITHNTKPREILFFCERLIVIRDDDDRFAL